MDFTHDDVTMQAGKEKKEEEPSYMLWTVYPGESKWAVVKSTPLMLVLAKFSKVECFYGLLFFFRRRRVGERGTWIGLVVQN